MLPDVLCAKKNLWPGTTGSVMEIYWLVRSNAGRLDVFVNSYWSGLWALILRCEDTLFFIFMFPREKTKETTPADRE